MAACLLVTAAAAIALMAASASAVALGLLLSPLAGVPLTIALIGVTWAGSALLSVWSDRLLDPLGPTLAAVVVFGVSALSSMRRRADGRRGCGGGSSSISRLPSFAASWSSRTFSSSAANVAN